MGIQGQTPHSRVSSGLGQKGARFVLMTEPSKLMMLRAATLGWGRRGASCPEDGALYPCPWAQHPWGGGCSGSSSAESRGLGCGAAHGERDRQDAGSALPGGIP